MSSKNPRKWRFTWEAQSHTPTLKLFLFDSHTKPSIHCKDLEVRLNLAQNRLLVSWIEDEDADAKKVSLLVPIPKVLIDPCSSLSFRALDDHVEVKLVLLLPVDHPIVSSFGSLLNLSDEGENNEVPDAIKPLDMDSDLKRLSLRGVHFYCRSCSTRLTESPLENFVEMPSVNWREVADNWFGACCCSFGVVSEKLVNRYASAYACSQGVCLLDSTTVIICKDDLIGCKFPDWHRIQKYKPKHDLAGENGLREEAIQDFGTNPGRVASCDCPGVRMHNFNGKFSSLHLNSKNQDECLKCKVREDENNGNEFCTQSALDLSENVPLGAGCCGSACHAQDYIDDVSMDAVPQTSLVAQKTTKVVEFVENQRSFLNGFLGNVFMARAYNLSVDIEWNQFFCPQCSHLLGAYPCANSDAPVDDGVRLFKCYLATSLPVGALGDLFRRYTLERMFTNQLMESAKDELSFRTVVRDLTTRTPMLQIALLNPNSWCCSGNCLNADSNVESVSKLDLHPVIKILFSDCSSNAESQLRVLEDWVTGNLADEVFMLTPQIEELVEIMESAKDVLPGSCTSFQGLSLSSMRR